ncbi:MAG: pentapeptide repeat-containing protein [Deltaproteobacteria bacterium HGW-Deltaproteobacteria-10]|nr:MAG: pentapeptide repeat-containing protein [Deltaproteobacteria bacterium HGW-Deltaproteobacteria-10]
MQAGNRVFLSLIVILMIGMLSVSGVYAYSEADLQKLRKTNSCPKCNLDNANLSGVNLSNANLAGTRLFKANLNKADLSGAKLSGADLYMANLKEAKLSGADLSRATWTDGSRCKDGSIGECKK